MRKLILIFLISLIGFNAKADPIGTIAVRTFFTGVPVVVFYSFYWYDDFKKQDGLLISPSLDAKMIVNGMIDFKLYTAIKKDQWIPYIAWEVFNAPVYLESFTVGLDYRVIDRKSYLNLGIETGTIYNQDQWVWTNALCAEIGLILDRKFSVSLRSDIQTRPELTGDQYDTRLFGNVLRLNNRVKLTINL